MKKYLKKISLEIILIILIVAIGAFLRLYHIELFGFADDQARDANTAQQILHGDFVLEGPQFSVDTSGERGHLGPFNFYLIAPMYFLFNCDPLGNILLIAILSIASVYLIYLVGKKYFNSTTGIVSAIILCFSYYVLYHSRFPWNPHIMIFFVLLMLYFLYKAIEENEKYYLAAGLTLGIVTQTQASAFLFFPCFIIFFLFKLVKLPKIKIILSSIVIFLLTYIPLFIYDIKNNFVNSKAYLDLLLGRGHTPDYVASGRLPFARPFMDYFNSLFGINFQYEKIFFVLLGAVLTATVIYILIYVKSNLSKIIATFGGVFGAVFVSMAYKNKLEEYFFLVITPFIILLVAYFLTKLFKMNIVTRVLAIILIALFIFQSQKFYWKDVLGKINRTYAAEHPSQILWPDIQRSVNYMVEIVQRNSNSLNQTFTINYLQTCPPTPFVNFKAFNYAFNLKKATPSQNPDTKINFYIIQPPESLICANIPKGDGEVISSQQFGKVIVVTHIK